MVRQYLLENPNIVSAEIPSFGTIAVKGAVRDVGRAMGMSLDEVGTICDSMQLNEQKQFFAPNDLKEKYPELFKFVDLLDGVIVSVGTHPAGVLCSTRNLSEELGMFTLSTTPYPVACLDMYGLDATMWTKMDELG